MRFLYPAFLFALLAIIIPILIHLFSFRKFTTVYFSNVNYLKNIKRESKRKSQLKHLLMLLARIMAITCLVFLFAQPYIPPDNQEQKTNTGIVNIYIDNSFSMNALSSKGQLVEVARNKALEIVDTYPPDTRFRLLTNDLQPRHQHYFNKEQLIQQITEVRISPRSVPLSRIYNRFYDPTVSQDARSMDNTFMISDFQHITSDFENIRRDISSTTYLMPIRPEKITNLYIDSCWMEIPAHKPGQEELLHVRIRNHSDESYQNLPVKLFLNDTIKALANFSIEARGEQVVELKYLNLNPGIQTGKVEISDYPITHDNTYFISYNVERQLSALAIYGDTQSGYGGIRYLWALFDEDPYVRFEEMNVDNLTISKLEEFNTIFLINIGEIGSGLMNELQRINENGTSVVFFPENTGSIENYNQFLSRFSSSTLTHFDTARVELGGLEWEHPIYSQVFRERDDKMAFPKISGSFRFSSATKISETPLLWFRSGQKALSVQSSENGSLFIFSFPLSSSNEEFARHILFAPTLYSLVINSVPRQKISYTIGREASAHVKNLSGLDLSKFSIILKDDPLNFIPEFTSSGANQIRINLNDFFASAGHYMINYGDTVVSSISLNYDRAESSSVYFTTNELKTLTEEFPADQFIVMENTEQRFSEIFEEISTGKKLWKLFLVLSILFILAEALIARLWK
jgi:hypothetical protein